MTLGRDRRGADWRPSRPAAGHDDRRGVEAGKQLGGSAAPWGGVEVEELPAQPVLASGRGRPGLSAILVAGVLVLILAAGLGFLGGRPAPSPTAPAVAAVSPAPSVPAYEFGPRVTPGVPCLARTEAVPEPLLEADGRSFAGVVEILGQGETDPAPTPALVPLPVFPSPPATIELRSDIVTLIHTIGDVCATTWRFDLSNLAGSINLESFTSPEVDPERALQNQFALDLAAYRGSDYDLRGVLTFPGFRIQASWPIRILPFDAPSARLSVAGKEVNVEPGCDLQLILGTGYSELVNPCDGDVVQLPAPARIRVPNTFLSLQFPINWFIQGASVSCGTLTEGRFQPDEGCGIGWTDEGTSLRIELPAARGTWSLAINGCATQLLSDVTNQVCGTWYATIELRPKPG